VVDVHAEFDHANSIRARAEVYCAIVSSFQKKLAQLKSDLVTQGRRVNELMLKSVESFFDRDPTKADSVIQGDEVIDKVNVEIERAAVPLLAMGSTDEHEIRSVLTIVKINNELERVADCGVNIAETVKSFGTPAEQVPPTFRVMANSVVGMMRDANRALDELNTDLAQQVLAFDDTVDRFKREIVLDAEEKVAGGSFGTQFAFALLDVTKNLERIADHCTNICEQVIYVESGLVVRHLPEGWSKPHRPEDVV
jgi:phosphate transport system protein